MKHVRSVHACRAPPPAAPLMSAADGTTTLFAVVAVALGTWGPMCVVGCAQVGLHACRSSGVKVRGAKEVHVHQCLLSFHMCAAYIEHMHMCVLRQQRSCTCHNFRDCIAIKRPQHMRCDPTPVDASKSVHSGQMCSMLHSIPWKEGKQCRDLQLSKLCFCCMRHPKLLLLWLPTVCGVFITLCPVMGVFGPATGASRS